MNQLMYYPLLTVLNYGALQNIFRKNASSHGMDLALLRHQMLFSTVNLFAYKETIKILWLNHNEREWLTFFDNKAHSSYILQMFLPVNNICSGYKRHPMI